MEQLIFEAREEGRGGGSGWFCNQHSSEEKILHSASCLYQNLRKYIDQSKVFGFFNKEDFAKTKSLDQRLPPTKKKYGRILNSTQRYMMNTNVLDIHLFYSIPHASHILKLSSQKNWCRFMTWPLWSLITAFDFGVFPTGRNYRQKTKYRQKCDCLVTSVNHPYICQDKPAKELCTIAFWLYLILVALTPGCALYGDGR